MTLVGCFGLLCTAIKVRPHFISCTLLIKYLYISLTLLLTHDSTASLARAIICSFESSSQVRLERSSKVTPLYSLFGTVADFAGHPKSSSSKLSKAQAN